MKVNINEVLGHNIGKDTKKKAYGRRGRKPTKWTSNEKV